MHIWVFVSGETALIASVKPFMISVLLIKISSTPWLFRFISTLIQKDALSFWQVHIPSTSFFALVIETNGDLNSFVDYFSFLTDFENHCVHPYNQMPIDGSSIDLCAQ
nr:hypothetical protein [Dyadobacter tibetensis]